MSRMTRISQFQILCMYCSIASPRFGIPLPLASSKLLRSPGLGCYGDTVGTYESVQQRLVLWESMNPLQTCITIQVDVPIKDYASRPLTQQHKYATLTEGRRIIVLSDISYTMLYNSWGIEFDLSYDTYHSSYWVLLDKKLKLDASFLSTFYYSDPNICVHFEH